LIFLTFFLVQPFSVPLYGIHYFSYFVITILTTTSSVESNGRRNVVPISSFSPNIFCLVFVLLDLFFFFLILNKTNVNATHNGKHVLKTTIFNFFSTIYSLLIFVKYRIPNSYLCSMNSLVFLLLLISINKTSTFPFHLFLLVAIFCSRLNTVDLCHLLFTFPLSPNCPKQESQT
jgi:hypothetical protein